MGACKVRETPALEVPVPFLFTTVILAESPPQPPPRTLDIASKPLHDDAFDDDARTAAMPASSAAHTMSA